MTPDELFKCTDNALRTVREIMERIELLSERVAEGETGLWSAEIDELRSDYLYATGEQY